MLPTRSIAVALREKQRLQAEIARQRRSIDRDCQRLTAEGRRLASWRTYVARFPAQTLSAMFGVGLMAGAGWRSASWRRRLGRWLLNAGILGARSATWSDLAAVWSAFRDSSTNKTPPPQGN